MFLSVIHFFNVLIFLNLTLAILACILLVKVPMRYGVKFILIPLVLLSTYVLTIEGEKLLGRPYAATPVGMFEFYDYRVIDTTGVKEIELWVIQDKKSRLYLIPYSADTEQSLSKAKTNKKKGSRSEGRFNRGTGAQQQQQLSIEEIPTERAFIPKNRGDEVNQ